MIDQMEESAVSVAKDVARIQSEIDLEEDENMKRINLNYQERMQELTQERLRIAEQMGQLIRSREDSLRRAQQQRQDRIRKTHTGSDQKRRRLDMERQAAATYLQFFEV
jgi:hypothetical protein